MCTTETSISLFGVCVCLQLIRGWAHSLSESRGNWSHNLRTWSVRQGSSGGSVGEESACNAGNPDLIPGSGRSPGEGDDNALQYSYLENFMDSDRLQSLESQRFGHNKAINTHTQSVGQHKWGKKDADKKIMESGSPSWWHKIASFVNFLTVKCDLLKRKPRWGWSALWYPALQWCKSALL